MEDRALAQLRVIHLVVHTLRVARCSAWLFGGWGLDARIGRITRDHGDIEFWVDRTDGERSKAILAGAGATVLHERDRPAGHEGAVPGPAKRRSLASQRQDRR
jgi:hypothetical protein